MLSDIFAFYNLFLMWLEVLTVTGVTLLYPHGALILNPDVMFSAPLLRLLDHVYYLGLSLALGIFHSSTVESR